MKKIILSSAIWITLLAVNSFPAFSQSSDSQRLPNILVIVLDDARYDMFAPNGGPDFFQTPSIDRIAHEGVNFKNAFLTTSLCCPSRASIYTGLYAHHHGALNNATSPKPGLTYVSSVLQNAGYYTGFIGKWLYNYTLPDRPVGFNYWAVTDSLTHVKPVVIFNDGTITKYSDNDEIVFTNLSLDFLRNKVPAGKPWLLFLCHRIPHTPYQPLPDEKTLYQDATINFPVNFYTYKRNFPSYLYPDHQYAGDSADLDQNIRDYYETCFGAEHSVDSLLQYLQSVGILNRTMIIFTSDNGFLFGEHDLSEKTLSYDESIRAPLFIRYPLWFEPGTAVNDEFATNIDIAPTLLDAAGIPDTFHMDGVSLRKIANKQVHRNNLFYESYIHDTTNWEAVRSFKYAYIYSYCSDVTEEFYDLTLDPKENRNLIFDPSYENVIQLFRLKRLRLRVATNDTIYPGPGNCNLQSFFYADADGDGFGNPLVFVQSNTVPLGYVGNNLDCNDSNAHIHPGALELCNGIDDNCNGQIDEGSCREENLPDESSLKPLSLYPNPNNGQFILEYHNTTAGNSEISVYDITGRKFFVDFKQVNKDENFFSFDLSLLNNGTYFLEMKNIDTVERIKFLIQK